jgi:NADP-dependent 3-hydroxy acid dehydrogenase YdfG
VDVTERPSQRTDPLDGQAAVVTGASSGIGAATARVLAEDGADVALAARRTDRLESLADEIRTDTGSDAAVVPTDVTDPDAVDALVEATVDRFGRLDAAVCNAGLVAEEPLAEMSNEDYELMRGVNVDGMFYTARAAMPHLVETSGHLVFMGSMSGNHPRPATPVYAATKWWTRGLAISLQARYGEEDVAVSCINPTEVRTEFGSETGTPSKESFDEGEVTEPIEIADAVAYAVRQRSPNSVTSLDIYRRDKLSHF